MGKPKLWLALFSPAGEVRHWCGLMLDELLCNCGNSEICSDDCVIFVCVLTEQLPYLGGLYHQGWQTAVTAQVRVFVCTYNTFVCFSVFN